MMQPAQERAAGDGLLNVRDAGVRVIGGRRVIERKKYSGDDLNSEQEQQHASEDVRPARAPANRLVQRLARNFLDARPLVQPVVEFLQFRFRHIPLGGWWLVVGA